MRKKDISSLITDLNKQSRIKIRLKKLKDGKQSIYLDQTIRGIREYDFLGLYLLDGNENISTNETTIRIAKACRDKRELDILSEKTGINLRKPEKVNLIDFWNGIIKKKNHKTAEMYQCARQNWIRVHGTKLDIDRVTANHIGEYLASLKHLSQTTQHHYLFAIRYCLSEAIKADIITKNPATSFSIKQSESMRNFLSIEEVRRIAQVQGVYIQLPFLFACYTGLRLGDLRKLQWKDIKDDHIIIHQEKTKDIVYIPLYDYAKELLPLLDHSKKHIFQIPTSRVVQYQTAKLMKLARIDQHITFHCSRHTFATMLLNNDVPYEVVGKLLGHRDIKATKIYAKIVNKKLDEAITKLPKL
jgi:integrase